VGVGFGFAVGGGGGGGGVELGCAVESSFVLFSEGGVLFMENDEWGRG
jgi:hypothetical protein